MSTHGTVLKSNRLNDIYKMLPYKRYKDIIIYLYKINIKIKN